MKKKLQSITWMEYIIAIPCIVVIVLSVVSCSSYSTCPTYAGATQKYHQTRK